MRKSATMLIAAMLPLAAMVSCSKDIENTINIDVNLNHTEVIPVTSWGLSKSELKSKISEDFVPVSESADRLIYEYHGETELMQAYQFDSQGRLEASFVMMPEGAANFSDIRSLLQKFDSRGKKGDVSVYSYEAEGIAATSQVVELSHSRSYHACGFAQYEPSGGEDSDAPYVDLGLSVCWAKCNVGASQPEQSGKFFAWAETSTKSEYWRENYDYCDSENGYVFNYYNAYSEISGTKYDAATKVCGADWRMPTKAEANELIYYCTWEPATLNGVSGFEVTGPNGNSIFLPDTPYKYQAREGNHNEIWTGNAISKTSEDAYTLKFPTKSSGNKPTLDIRFKAWGHAIRPVYDPK